MKLPDELQKKLEQLEKYDGAYYNGTNLVSDVVYDVFKDSVIKLLPPDHPYLNKVGHPVCSAWPKESHSIFMGSLNKVNTEDEIREWIKKVEQALGMKNLEFVLQSKIDGFSLECKYDTGKIGSVLTRGDNNMGENILPNARSFRNLPFYLHVKEKVYCRGEGVIYRDDFDEIQRQTKNGYKNPRNAASGLSRRFDGKFSKYIRFIAYDINAKVKTETEKIDTLKKLGFFTAVTNICKTVDDVLKIYRSIRDNLRDKSPFEIDGLVLKLNSIELQERMGVQHNRPEGCLALKFESDNAVTTIKDIIVQIGRTGKFTPVAILEPVDLMGSTITKASVHNFSYIEENRIGVGAEIVLQKCGDIIPQVTEVLIEGSKFEKPIKCPSCGGPLVDDGVNIWCRGKVCRERDINRIVYWIETLDMKGFSQKFIEKLWDVGKIRSVADIYKLTPDDFLSVDGIGEKTVKSFFKTLESTSEMLLNKFIIAMGIPSCSKSTAEDLVNNFGTWDKIATINPGDLQKLPGYAEVSSETICGGIAEVNDMALQLLTVIKIKEKKQGKLTGKSFCVTGSLASMGRKEFEAVVVDNGGIVKSTVAEGLSFLVTNDKGSGSAKNQKSKKLGIGVIDEKQFFDLLGVMPEVKKVEDKKENDIEIITEKLF